MVTENASDNDSVVTTRQRSLELSTFRDGLHRFGQGSLSENHDGLRI